jgi:16S rRNA (cytosine967-C5)-methyltransferase
VALDALDRIEGEGAYANLLLPRLLARSGLDERDRAFVTDLVYGTTRMRRACDALLDRFLSRPPSARVRNALRLGTYQLAFGDVPPHAAVAETVGVAPRPARGLVNAVLRRVAEAVAAGLGWPDDATRLSVPDWVVERLVVDLGRDRALGALAAMNEPATVAERDDGYVQDPASQQVAAAVGVEPGDRVLDACAAPGGKTTAMARDGVWVAAADVRVGRLGLVQANVARLRGTGDGRPPGDPAGRVAVVAADGTRPPWRQGVFDRALVDAPCSGLGTLRRRPDLRWRIDEEAIGRLADLQRRLVAATIPLVRPGGLLAYSVCTLTAAESLGIDEALAASHPGLRPLDPPGPPWEPWGRGAILLPQNAGTDGMCLFRYTRS